MFWNGRTKFKFLLAMLAVVALTACAGNGENSIDQFSTDEMTGLIEPEPTKMPEAEEWTFGPVEQAKGFYACSKQQEAKGVFTCGTLVSSDRMPVEGPGFRLALPASRDVYATYDLIAILSRAAEAMEVKYPGQEGLRIGELSKIKGGYSRGHDSHQNGLDADLGYFRAGMGPLQPGNHSFETMVVRYKVQKLFDIERNYEFIKMIVRTGRANRVFVHPEIKYAICDYAKSLGEDTEINPYLSVIRGYPYHADHMHVRITCPRNSPKCRNQVLPAAEAECTRPVPKKKSKPKPAPPSI